MEGDGCVPWRQGGMSGDSWADKLQRIAQAMGVLRLPSVVAGLVCLTLIVANLFFSRFHEGDRFLIPAFIGLLWAASAYAFIVTFRSVPERAREGMSLLARVGRRIHRAWYGCISLVFFAATAASLWITYRMLSAWLRDHGG